KAREYLEKAKSLDATNLDVLRLLADLHMDADNWKDALTNYQSVVLGAGDSLGTADQANLYVKMARARVGMGEASKAIPMIERALELVPGNETAARLGVELAEGRSSAERVKALRCLYAMLREQTETDEEGDGARCDQAIGLLGQIAEVQATEMSLPEEAIRTLEEMLDLQPGEPGILHRMLELFTESKRWSDATNVLERLAEDQTDSLVQSKYLYAGAVILRDQVQDDSAAVGWFRRVLEIDPGHEKAYVACYELMQRGEEWHELTRLIRMRLKNLPDSVPVSDRIELLNELGIIYEEQLGDPVTALAAFEQTVALAPRDQRDSEDVVERRRQVMALALELGGDHVDRALVQAHELISIRPMEFDLYHRMVGLYAERGDHDRTIRICRTLKFLKQATDHEAELAERGEGKFVQARGTITHELWRSALYHEMENPILSDLFSVIWPMVTAREGRTHAHYGLKRDDREPVSMQGATALSRFLAYSCQVLDAPVPDLFVRQDEQGGLSVGALAEMDGRSVRTVFPSVLAGRDALAQQTEPALAFRVGRAVARARPEHILAAALPSAGNLRNAVFGAVALTHPEAPIPKESHDPARDYAQEIQKYLPPARQDQLKAITSRIVDSGAVDIGAWLEGVAYTVTRAGFLMSDSLETAVRIMSTEGDKGVPIPAKERIKDLIGYSVSPQLFDLRRTLNMK
ncbi:MAG: hypothetical protein GY946_16590, partial [bacterium]|nr:hypothetical protein [bacterium]